MGRAFGVGITIGKFNPPHLGHKLLIDRAAERCDQLHVIVCERPDQTLRAADRARWLKDEVPENVVFHLTPDDLPGDDSAGWAARTISVLGREPDVAFTSEAYGDNWARKMRCPHVAIDRPREQVPVRATEIRADLASNFHLLVPSARADLARRVVLVGAESTGKTTLAAQLARECGTVWVPEWARVYDLGKQTDPGYDWTGDEFSLIGRQQAALEDALARRARQGLLFADTDALSTCVWRRRYLSSDDPDLLRVAAARRPDLYLLCDLDLPWRQDGTRESRSEREAMHDDFVATLDASGLPWTLVSGTGRDRLHHAIGAVRARIRFEPLV